MNTLSMNTMMNVMTFFPSTFMPAHPSVVGFVNAFEKNLGASKREIIQVQDRVPIPESSYAGTIPADFKMSSYQDHFAHYALAYWGTQFKPSEQLTGVQRFIRMASGVEDEGLLPDPVRAALGTAIEMEQGGNLVGGIAILYSAAERMIDYKYRAHLTYHGAVHHFKISKFIGMTEKDFIQSVTVGDIDEIKRLRKEELEREIAGAKKEKWSKEKEMKVDLPGNYSLEVKYRVSKTTLHLEITSWTYLSDKEFKRHEIGEDHFNYDAVPRPVIKYNNETLSFTEEEAHDGGGVSFYYELDLPRKKSGDGKHEFAVELPDWTKTSFTIPDGKSPVKSKRK